MMMNIWKISILLLYAMSLGMNLAKHGEPKEGKYDFWSTLLSCAILIFMLYMGGFFE